MHIPSLLGKKGWGWVGVHNARTRGGQSGAGRGDPHGNSTKLDQARVEYKNLAEKLANLMRFQGSAAEKKRINDKMKNIMDAGFAARRGRMEQKVSEKVSDLDVTALRPGEGIGDIKIGDSILKWKDQLFMSCLGDLNAQFSNFFSINDLDFTKNPCLIGVGCAFFSDLVGIKLEVDDNGFVVEITSFDFCFFDGVDLIGKGGDYINNVFGPPGRCDEGCMGFEFFWDSLGLSIRLGVGDIVSSIRVMVPDYGRLE